MNRRSLTQAISVKDPEIAGFLKAGIPKPLNLQEVSPAPDPRDEARPDIPAADSPPRERKAGGEEKTPVEAPRQMIMESGSAVPVTFRLPENLVRAMISASADRKIRRVKPFTQQSMATEAIEQWLKMKGYL